MVKTNSKLSPELASKLNKLLAQIKNLDEKTLYYIFGGVLLFIFLLDYFIVMGPQLHTLTDLGPKIKILSEDIVKTKADILKLNEYRKEVKALRENINKLQLELRSREEVPIVLERVSRIADKNGVKVDQIMPDVQEQRKFLESPDFIYYSLPIFIEGQSSYHDFGRFLNDLEKDEIFFRTGNFSISSSGDSKLHNIKLTLKTIIYEINTPKEEK